MPPAAEGVGRRRGLGRRERETKGAADSGDDGLGRRGRWRRDLSARSGAWPIWIEGGGGRVREKRIEGGVARVCFGWGYIVSLGAFTKLTWLFRSCARVTRDSWGDLVISVQKIRRRENCRPELNFHVYNWGVCVL